MNIDIKWLREKNACADGVEWFKKKYGESSEIPVEEVYGALCREGMALWCWWLVGKAELTRVVELNNGDKLYYERGKLHRLGGLPAVVRVDGYKEYCECGQLHREGGLPAVEWADGCKAFWVRGLLHREGGLPAIEWSGRRREYWEHGKLHREGGLPAVECEDGEKFYFVRGRFIRDEKVGGL